MATILLAEDDAHTTRVMQLWLTRHKHAVIEARDGLEALEKLRVTPVDLLISDMNMPRMTGLQLVLAVRTELRLDMPILMFSSRCDYAELAREVNPFSVALYPKPFVPSRLCAHINQLLANRAPSASAQPDVRGLSAPAEGQTGSPDGMVRQTVVGRASS